jgi:hypothetical protein
MFSRCLCVITWLLLCAACRLPARAQEIKPIETEVTFVTCVNNSTIVTEKEVCYIYDVAKKQKFLEITIAGGINVTAGALIFGGEAKAMVRATIRYKLDTAEKEAIKDAQKRFDKILKEKENVEKARDFGFDLERIIAPKKVQQCKPDDPLIPEIKKALGEGGNKKK